MLLIFEGSGLLAYTGSYPWFAAASDVAGEE